MALLIYFANRIVGIFGAIFALVGHGGATFAKVVYYAFIWSQIHDDSTWYIAISQRGYWPQDTAFFPAYPAIMHVLTSITGISPSISGLLVSNICFILDIYLIVGLIGMKFGKKTGIITAAIWGLSPMSFDLTSAYTEPVFVFGILLALLGIERKKLWATAFGALLATLSRNEGVLLLIPIIGYAIREFKTTRKIEIKTVISLLSPLAAAGAYGLFMLIRFGDPLEFSHMEVLWGRKMADPFLTLIQGFVKLPRIWHDNTWYGHEYYALEYGAVAFALLALPTIWRHMPRSWFWFSVSMILIPLADPGTGVQTITQYDRPILDFFFSFDRFTLPMIPVFVALALRLKEFRPGGWVLWPASVLGLLTGTVNASWHLFLG